MKENFKVISDALSKAGFTASLEDSAGVPLDFKITPYSLNTKLSFRFEDLDELQEFLQNSGNGDANNLDKQLPASFMELGLNPKEFFYVNFFEKGKEEEEM